MYDKMFASSLCTYYTVRTNFRALHALCNQRLTRSISDLMVPSIVCNSHTNLEEFVQSRFSSKRVQVLGRHSIFDLDLKKRCVPKTVFGPTLTGHVACLAG